ncbi:hypothetical protein KKF61_00085 [Patescibacteria group bacterium]|nr:hypothetical protein [Patescibacteria group bacterium]MBU0964050.1 hypothetical protein [Patescibacteria group bacterium]
MAKIITQLRITGDEPVKLPVADGNVRTEPVKVEPGDYEVTYIDNPGATTSRNLPKLAVIDVDGQNVGMTDVGWGNKESGSNGVIVLTKIEVEDEDD